MRIQWVIKNHSYSIKTAAPGVTDIDYPLLHIWLNVTTDVAYILDAITNGQAVWLTRAADTIFSGGNGTDIYVIGESYLGDVIRSTPGLSVTIPPNVVISEPGVNEHQVLSVKLDQNHKLVASYTE